MTPHGSCCTASNESPSCGAGLQPAAAFRRRRFRAVTAGSGFSSVSAERLPPNPDRQGGDMPAISQMREPA
jgi:hypothetical protein